MHAWVLIWSVEHQWLYIDLIDSTYYLLKLGSFPDYKRKQNVLNNEWDTKSAALGPNCFRRRSLKRELDLTLTSLKTVVDLQPWLLKSVHIFLKWENVNCTSKRNPISYIWTPSNHICSDGPKCSGVYMVKL